MGKNYCTISIEKVKTFESMQSRFEHNHRLRDIPNADPELSADNEVLVNKEERTYQELYKEAIENSDYYRKTNSKIRKDAVKGIEVVVSFSHDAEETIDMDQWKKDNLEFLGSFFGGKQNIKDAVFHADEATGHMHVFIVPLMEDGRLCAKQFLGGRKELVRLQTEYAKAMSAHGLSRGERGSFLKHEDIKRFYGLINDALEDETPPPKKNEQISDYYERISKVHRENMIKAASAQHNAYREKERELNEKVTKKIESLERRLASYEPFVKKAKKKFGTIKAATARMDEIEKLHLGLDFLRVYKPKEYEKYLKMKNTLLAMGDKLVEIDQNNQAEKNERNEK